MDNNRVLLISPARDTLTTKGRPHLGLGLIAKKLLDAGFDVRILDYIITRDLPSLRDVIESFKPATVGITINTAFWSMADSMLDELANYPDIKKIIGGPHASLYYDLLCEDKRLHYIFVGESEENVVAAVANPELPPRPVVIDRQLTQMDKLPLPAFEVCCKPEMITEYPLQTSRGCPFACIFCEVSKISSAKWRPRTVESIIDELKLVKTKYPNVRIIEIQDDNPLRDTRRFKDFLKEYLKICETWELRVDNIRADNVDDELVELLGRAKCLSICLGVEHGNPEMFKSVNKGETLDQIAEAARMIKKGDMKLGMCFVIGLPGDSFEKTKDSVRFAIENKADYMFWNILVPHHGTRVRKWFEENGRVRDERNISSLVDDQIFCDLPTCDCDAFPSEEIMKSRFYAILKTNNYYLKKRNMRHVIKTAIKYGFIKELISSLTFQLWRKNFQK